MTSAHPPAAPLKTTPSGRSQLHVDILWVALLVALLFVPFVNKAIHIDDGAFLNTGLQLGWNPLQSSPADVEYQGQTFKALSPYESPHPPLIPYLLKILQALCDRNEVALHLAFLVFPVLALWGLVRLQAVLEPGNRSGRWLLLVLFGSLPAFVVNGQNLMTDVPTLAFLLLGAALSLPVATPANWRGPWWGSFWLTCAAFSSYQALFFIAPLGLVAWSGCPDSRQRIRRLLLLLLPALLLAAWSGVIYAGYGIFPGLKGTFVAAELARGFAWPVVWGKVTFVLAMIGASLILVLPLRLAAAPPAQRWRGGALAGLVTMLFFALAPDAAGSWPARLALAGLCGVGTLGLWVAGRDLVKWRTAEPERAHLVLFCCGWLAVALAYNFLLLPFGSARYLLPLFPVLFLVLLREAAPAVARARRAAVAVALASVLWGGASAWADYVHAGSYRTMAAELADLGRSLQGGEQIWYIGEWGMRHYFDRAGARYLLATSLAPRPGDYVVIPEMPRFWAPAAALQSRLVPVASREFRSPLPLRLFNRRSGAGFYCHHWGLLPFALTTEPDEVFQVLIVR